jgi:hypothetical protein
LPLQNSCRCGCLFLGVPPACFRTEQCAVQARLRARSLGIASPSWPRIVTLATCMIQVKDATLQRNMMLTATRAERHNRTSVHRSKLRTCAHSCWVHIEQESNWLDTDKVLLVRSDSNQLQITVISNRMPVSDKDLARARSVSSPTDMRRLKSLNA